MKESVFSKRLKQLSITSLKIIIRGTGLKPKYELILWKFYIENKSYVEISDELGIEISTVGKVLWKAKKELQRIIESEKDLIPEPVKSYIDLLLAEKEIG